MSGGIEEFVAPDLAREWDRLSHSVSARFTDGSPYCAAVATARSIHPTVVTVRDNDQLSAVVPLAVRRFGPVALARLFGHGLGQGGDAVVADTSAAGRLADRLADARGILHLQEIPADSLLLDALRSSRRWRTQTHTVSKIPTLTLRTGATPRDVRSRRTLSQLRSARSRYDAAGEPVQFELLQTVDDLGRRWEDMCAVAARRGESRPEWDEWLAGERGALVRRVLDAEARAGRMRVLGVTVGGNWVGHDIAVQSGTTWYRYLTHFDPDHARLQPGHQLMVWVVEHHDELGVNRIHHGRGSTVVKRAWSDAEADAVDVWAIPDTVPGGRLLLAAITGIRVAREKTTIGLRSAVRRMLRRS